VKLALKVQVTLEANGREAFPPKSIKFYLTISGDKFAMAAQRKGSKKRRMLQEDTSSDDEVEPIGE
jgi:hypothetical protein